MASRSRNTANSIASINNALLGQAIVDRRYLDQVVVSGSGITDIDLRSDGVTESVSSANQLIVFVNSVIQVPGEVTSVELNASTTINYRLKSSGLIEFSTGDLTDGDVINAIYDNSATGNVANDVITADNISTTGLSPNSRYVISVGSTLSEVSFDKSPDWQTITATTFTAAIFAQYFIDTSSNAITITLPASSSNGEEISFLDVGSNLATNNLTITPTSGGSIQGQTADETLIINTDNSGFTLVHAGSNNWFLKDR